MSNELNSKYDPAPIEEKWKKEWEEKKYFYSTPNDKKPYTIVIPPPNITGILHMGHILNNTIQDILCRKARMDGYNVCWVPGTDHASIATEAKVVNMLKDKGISKKDLTREKFLEYCWEWKKKYGDIILNQLKELGVSCDWGRTKFTMDDDLSESVIKVFVDLYEKGEIYRGKRIINWDCKAQTALSDEEIIYKTQNATLYYVKYLFVENEKEYLTVATTRPETIFGDVAICVNPEDVRYKHLHGKYVINPLNNEHLPIITDNYVDKEFGTGCLKITPAHDINDYNIGRKHKLKIKETFNPDGTLNELTLKYNTIDRFDARKKIVEELKSKDLLLKFENYQNNIGYSERTDTIVETRISDQWFCKMKRMGDAGLEVVLKNKIKFHPDKFINLYKHWIENIKDWCISRQLWWGHQIPAYYLPNGEIIVATTKKEAYEKAKTKYLEQVKSINDLKQDPDCLDTWFSSWLWPISVFDGIRNPNNKDISYYYPTNTLVTAPEILFFWVARMIFSGLEYRNQVPFTDVYFTGIVRDAQHRKMSKSLGNSPDPNNLISQYGSDGVRVGLMLSSQAGNDLLFDEKLCLQGRNFCNKIWNAFRLIENWNTKTGNNQNHNEEKAILWFENKLNKSLKEINNYFESFKISEALMTFYKLFWDDFCSLYLEIIKPHKEQTISKECLEKTKNYFKTLLKIGHPFIPFISEELYQNINNDGNSKTIMFEVYPKAGEYNEELLKEFEITNELINQIRKFRQEKNISNSVQIKMETKQNYKSKYNFDDFVLKMGNISELKIVKEYSLKGLTFVVQKNEYLIEFQNNEINKDKIIEEIKRLEGFEKSILSKLNNTKFVENAPKTMVELENKKLKDTREKLTVLKNNLK